MVAVVQLAERLPVAQEVVGSNPISHPNDGMRSLCPGGVNPISHPNDGMRSLCPGGVNPISHPVSRRWTLGFDVRKIQSPVSRI